MGKTALVVLIVIVVAAAAGYGGYRMGDNAGFERANQVRQQFAQSRQGAAGGFGGANAATGGQGRSAGISGVVKSVDGDTLTVTLGQRDVKVKLSDKTQILKSAASTRTDLTAGTRVMITPETGNGGGGADAGGGGAAGGASNTLNAASVTILPAQ